VPAIPSPRQTSASAAARGGLAAWRERDHTRGRLLTSLVVLAVPLLATSISAVVFQLVDLTFVSRLGDEVTTAVIVTNQSVRQILFMVVLGASLGAQALMARAVGQGRPGAAERVAGQVLLVGIGLSLGVAALGWLAPRPLLAAMNVSPEVLAVGVPYVRLVLLLNFGLVFTFLVNAVLNGAGDTTTPMLLALVQTAAALLGEWLLIFGHLGFPALGIEGVALGTAAGQLVSLLLAARVLFGGRTRIHLRLAHMRPDGALIRRILALSWPPGLQMIGAFLVTVIFLRLAGDFGEKAQAAYSIGLRLSMVGPILAFPIAGACATLVGQNLGAGHVARAWRAIGVGLAVHAPLLWTVAAVLFLFRHPIVAAFSRDPEVIRIGAEFLLYQAGTFVAWGLYFVFFRALQGAGDVRAAMAISLGSSLLLTLPLGVTLSAPWGLGLGPTGLFAGTLLGSWVSTLATGAWLATGRWARPALRPAARPDAPPGPPVA
jgi:putative MATE family efflux protein